MASGASLIGIGSDIAGSLRLPAHFCGTWGHKPTPGVVSFRGHYPSCKDEGAWEEAFTIGPLARYATDLRLLLHLISQPNVRENLDLFKPVNKLIIIIKKIQLTLIFLGGFVEIKNLLYRRNGQSCNRQTQQQC